MFSGECNKESCPGCSWRLSAALNLQSDGTSWLTVKSDGTHGQKVRPKGKKLWRPAEVAAIKAAFPDKALLSSASVRQCLADAGLELQVPKERLKQYISREKRRRRGGQASGQKPVVQALLEFAQAWSQKPTKAMVAGRLELRVVGKPDMDVGLAFNWTCRGFLNHAKNNSEITSIWPKTQVQCDFSDAIEGARRKVFPSSRMARDYPRMMRAVHAKLTTKTS